MPTRRHVFAGAAAGLRRRAARAAGAPKAVVLVVAALVATAFAVTPAYADDPGLNCAVTATATVSVTPSPVVYGHNALVQWSADCVNNTAEDALVISGPGFNPSTTSFPVGGGSRTVFIDRPGTVGWDVTVVDLSSDTGFSRSLASVSASVTGVTTVPDVRGDTQAQATSALAAAGYVLGGVGSVVDCESVNRVRSQSPGAGTVLLPGSPVSITLGRRPTPPAECK
ncbi:PASTA domain-containing protein [Streptomyces griseoruber]|uniref:PASTA domain-containing protein n=1 Tax=Streptomyces griseoruber TaxID=1943 RepID=UPI0012FE8F0E|nr:PASTA domain-containing protein [Streptomyces griseoruber]